MNRRAAITLALLAAAAGVAAIARFSAPKRQLPVIAPLPSFALTDQNGAPFSDVNLRGRVWIVDFIFTTCTQTCPRLTARMKSLSSLATRERMTSDIALVSITVDPENDTPEVLSKYAARAGADTRFWSFLTGPSEGVRDVVVKGFKMADQRVEKGKNEYDILHGNWFVLGDSRGNIRGFYNVENESDIEPLFDDVRTLVRDRSGARETTSPAVSR